MSNCETALFKVIQGLRTTLFSFCSSILLCPGLEDVGLVAPSAYNTLPSDIHICALNLQSLPNVPFIFLPCSIFLHNIYHQYDIYFTYLFISTPKNINPINRRVCLLCLLLNSQHLEQSLAHKCLVSIC